MIKTPDDLLTRIQNQHQKLYPSFSNAQSWSSLATLLVQYRQQRSPMLQQLDLQPRWFQASSMVGITLYVDLFSGTLKGLNDNVAYFKTLGITYIHLMPLLKSREGNNDGGYAVSDYQDIEPKLGTLDDFKNTISIYRDAGIAIAIDFVINHTAKEHRWAQAAMQGDPTYQGYYMMYDDETIPNQFNLTVPEVLPDIYPGNFTYYPTIKKYVFKSFSEFQWDLNFANPKVLEELINIFLYLANLGVAMIRLDAIPFIWKTLGTTCRNLPEAHELMKFFQLVKQYVCPGVAILGEAIVEPHEIYRYFGQPGQEECDVLYNATAMVNIWEALATRDGRMINIETDRFPLPEHGAWINYVRCHDDIGWGFNEAFIKHTGREPFSHKQYLISFYNGTFPNSFARGKNYQENLKTGDARTNGTLASLIGFQQEGLLQNKSLIDQAFSRYQLVNMLMFSLSGMPLIYSGDEWLQTNDDNHTRHVSKTDGRWLHRPAFDWQKVKTMEPPMSYQAYQWTKSLIDYRKNDARFTANKKLITLPQPKTPVFAFQRDEGKPLYCVYNFSEVSSSVLLPIKQGRVSIKNVLTGSILEAFNQELYLDPYAALWLEVI